MKKQILSRWKYIVISNESNKELTRFELDDNERLKVKMKRQKKRSLMNPVFQTKNEKKVINRPNTNFQINSQVIFSYKNETPNNFKVELTKFTLPPLTAQFPFLNGNQSTSISPINFFAKQDNIDNKDNNEKK